MKQMFVYIMASRKNGTTYIGVTSDIAGRVYKHKEGYYPKSFTSKYKVDKLVYYEIYDDELTVLSREKRLKLYKREWKFNLINENNPEWNDLYDTLF